MPYLARKKELVHFSLCTTQFGIIISVGEYAFSIDGMLKLIILGRDYICFFLMVG